MFWLIDAIEELITPKRNAFDVIKYCKAQIKYGEKKADWMRKKGFFDIPEEEKKGRK